MSDARDVGMPFSADKKTGFAAASDLHPGLLVHRVVDCHHLKPTIIAIIIIAIKGVWEPHAMPPPAGHRVDLISLKKALDWWKVLPLVVGVLCTIADRFLVSCVCVFFT